MYFHLVWGNLYITIHGLQGVIIMKLKIILFVFLLITIPGCSNQVGGDYLFNHIDQLEQAIDQSNWDEVLLQSEELKDIYEDSKWKIQLIGDEDEYEGLYQSINNLIAVVKEKDTTNARLQLASIKSILEDIYSL